MKSNKLLIVFLACFFKMHNVTAQWKDFYSELLGINLKISSNTHVNKFEIEKGIFGEIYIVLDDSNIFKYSLTITRKKNYFNLNKINERNEFKKSFLNECNCNIDSETFNKYDNFMSYRLKINLKSNIIGYTDTFYLNDYLYSFTYLSDSNSKFEKFENDYFIILKLIDKAFDEKK